MLYDSNTFFVFIPFVSFHSNRVSHKKVPIRLIEDFPQLMEVPDWMQVLVEYMAKYYQPSDVSTSEVNEVRQLEVAHYYLNKHQIQ